jgi:hypothetical protein
MTISANGLPAAGRSGRYGYPTVLDAYELASAMVSVTLERVRRLDGLADGGSTVARSSHDGHPPSSTKGFQGSQRAGNRTGAETVDIAVDMRWQRRSPGSSTTMIRRLVAAARIAFLSGNRNDLRIGGNKRNAMGFPPLTKGAFLSERAFSWPSPVQPTPLLVSGPGDFHQASPPPPRSHGLEKVGVTVWQ